MSSPNAAEPSRPETVALVVDVGDVDEVDELDPVALDVDGPVVSVLPSPPQLTTASITPIRTVATAAGRVRGERGPVVAEGSGVLMRAAPMLPE